MNTDKPEIEPCLSVISMDRISDVSYELIDILKRVRTKGKENNAKVDLIVVTVALIMASRSALDMESVKGIFDEAMYLAEQIENPKESMIVARKTL
jgi:hypothetical protein